METSAKAKRNHNLVNLTVTLPGRAPQEFTIMISGEIPRWTTFCEMVSKIETALGGVDSVTSQDIKRELMLAIEECQEELERNMANAATAAFAEAPATNPGLLSRVATPLGVIEADDFTSNALA